MEHILITGGLLVAGMTIMIVGIATSLSLNRYLAANGQKPSSWLGRISIVDLIEGYRLSNAQGERPFFTVGTPLFLSGLVLLAVAMVSLRNMGMLK